MEKNILEKSASNYLEPSRAPIHKLNRSLVLDRGNGRVHVLGDNISTVEQAAGHVLTMPS